MNSETRSRMPSFSASSVVSAGGVDANRARWTVDDEVRHERAPDPGDVQRPAGPRGDDADAGRSHRERRVPRRDLEAPELDTQRRAEALRIERHRETTVLGLGTDEQPEPLPRERRVCVPEPDASRAVEEPLHTARRRGGLRRRHDGADGHDSELDPRRKRAQRPAQGLPVDAGPGTRLDDADRLLRDIDPGVAPRVAEPVVEPVGEHGRRDRAEAIGELHLPAVPEPDAGEHPRERPSVVGLGDGVGDKRCCAKLAAARRGESAARPDEADREIQVRGGRAGHGDPRLALRRSAHVHARDRRSARQRVALE